LAHGVLGGAGALLSLGFGIFGHQWGALPYLAAFAAPGIASFAYSCSNQGSFFYNMHEKSRIKKWEKKYFNDDKLLKDFMAMQKSYNEGKGKSGSIDDLNALRLRREASLSEIAGTFGMIKHLKGYSVEFSSDSLDDLYVKTYQLMKTLDDNK
jgi:hypothetical protein